MNQTPIGFPDLPLGFSMALAQNPQALARFAELTDAQRQALISHTHAIGSRKEMKAFVASLADNTNQYF